MKIKLEKRKLKHNANVLNLNDSLLKAMELDSSSQKDICDLQNNDLMLDFVVRTTGNDFDSTQ